VEARLLLSRSSPQPDPDGCGLPASFEIRDPREVIPVRVVVLILGILGSLGAGLLAFFLLLAQAASDLLFEKMTQRTTKQAIAEGVDPTTLPFGMEMTTLGEWIEAAHWQGVCIWFLLGALVIGLVGAILGFNRRGFSAAMLLFGAFAAPVVVYPGFMTAVVPSLLLVAGILALFVRPARHVLATSESR
jgi:hypothetical protein